MENFYMDKAKIKQAAIDFLQALKNWYNREHIIQAYIEQGRELDEEKINITIRPLAKVLI
ncbi:MULTISPECIES: hypothetical protein [unclassified Acinetobacter]|uniref:hypothetical protein n=1 Tax=unclassified Acinetobacter TaxID=196816 RepID=UPI0035B6BE3E